MLEWINFGKISAERDDYLSNYFFDNGVLTSVIESPTSFLVLGRKGAGKTAVFKYLENNKTQFISEEDILIPLSFEDYSWNIHGLLVDNQKAESLAYKQSWRFVMLVEAVKAYKDWFVKNNGKPTKELSQAINVLEKIFDSPVPSIGKLIGRKLLKLSSMSLPKGGLSEDSDGIEVALGEVSFEDVNCSASLKEHLSQNIERVIAMLEEALKSLAHIEHYPKVFICFDRVDEAWDDVSFDSSRRVIAGLVSAADSITVEYSGKIRPVVFLREDIFDVLSINDANKLREDCGALLHWKKNTLSNLLLLRVNYYAEKAGKPTYDKIDEIFETKEMRQRQKPFDYILKRTMMRPRDYISIMNRIIESMREEADDPFTEEIIKFDTLKSESIYNAEPSYSDWLRKELLDEWSVQKPEIKDMFNALQNHGTNNFTRADFKREMLKIGHVTDSDITENLRFLFDNSVIGFKVGESNIWKYKCFYPSQGFVDSPLYKVHDGLFRALNLREKREAAKENA
ncbi:TPA: hypothetical protein ACPVXC_003581 [Vibrio parahaemolyticus]|uniref:P-loop ATPase, Sll1717 family n=1 Tax=Vibrio parahaemolyticus TaxID=670 RepID=UPI00111D4B72|nr:ATPase [Vibrio parahaemolyticus]EGR1153827.1 ATPase [Vibrio parahaemolyticus]ELB2214659.1 hypothetical protein [Vibrio parahaemolyticus]ELB2234443.1 hypothetical protein [Vibrio parahaemolyticus]MCG7820728.1 hypothetical protein [Vibrio parahaemolyticus]TOA67969.1 ATPase [Vibrio parahaemolyticus]